MLEMLIAMSALLLGLPGLLCPGFFLREVRPALGAHPLGGASLNATIGESVALAGGAEFEAHLLPLMSFSVLLAYR